MSRTSPVDAPGANDTSAGPPEPRPPGRGDLVVRVLGGLVAVAAGLVTALVEVFLAPLRLGGVRIPVSPLLAVGGNLALVWFTHTVTGRRGAIVAPALVWMAVMVVSSGRTDEGDLLLTGDNWVGLVTILVGSVAFAGGAYFLLVPRRPALPRGA